MPTYSARCPQCGNVQEYSASITKYETETPMCDKPECGTKTEFIFIPYKTHVVFEGSGWPGQTIKRQRLHQKAVNTPVSEFIGSGGKNLKKD